MCVPECGSTCDRLSECGVCAVCEGNTEVCGNPCDDTKPVFLNAMEDKSTRDVFDLYRLKSSNPDDFKSQNIKYFDGTKDVELSWFFNDSCINDVLAFKVKICEEVNSETNTNKCSSLPAKIFTTSNIHSRSLLIKNILEPHKKYCYNVASVSLDGTHENWAYNETEELPCFETGDEYCMQEHEPGLNCLAENENELVRPRGCISNEQGPTYGETNLKLRDGDCLPGTAEELKTCID